jgi:hypothetical protein
MARPVVALLTDFGLADHYVGAMKGVLLGVCPEATLVDITHDVPAHDVLAGALELAAAHACFPVGTVFLAVVDPGVGSARRGVAIEAGGQFWVGPDNGLFTVALRCAGGPGRAVELTESRYRRAAVSRTFEGRDRFAPAAGWLAAGVPLEAFGPAVPDLVTLAVPEPHEDGDVLAGEVLRVDRFGNLISNLRERHVERFGAGASLQVEAGRGILAPLVATYAEAPPAAVCALFGSSGHLEIAVPGASAATRLGLRRGSPVCVRRLPR